MPSPGDKSYIEELKKSLYSRNAPDVRTKRKLRFQEQSSAVKTDWGGGEEESKPPVVLTTAYEDHSMSFFTKLLIASILFCIVAVGIGAYLFYNGANLISANNIEISIAGPVSISGGEPVSFDVSAVNKNTIGLELVDMSVDFPAGTTDPDKPGVILQNYRKLLGNIPSDGSVRQTVRAVIFGEENIQKQITVTLTYSVKGSSAVFTKKQTYDVLIKSSPISLTASSFKEIASGQPFNIKVEIKSNSQQTLPNVIMKADYPFGYVFISSDLPPLSGSSVWKVGDLPPGGRRIITLSGKLSGENTDLRAFHFTVGAQSPTDPKNIGTQYMAVEQDITIQKPFISLNISIDNDQTAADHVGKFGQSERIEVNWFNNLPVAVSNMAISVALSGSAYDKTAVRPDQGYFDSAANLITWNQQTNPELGAAAAGDSGKVSFTVTPRDTGTAASPIINPTLVFNASVSGNRAQEADVPETISSAAARTTRISSSVSLSGRLVRTVGPITNSGPVPPKAEQATTYTVIWDVDNASNAVGGAVASVSLPPYVKWLGVTSPPGEDVTYDQNSGTVSWNVGSVGTHTVSSSRREMSFQISFMPNINQVNQAPFLVNKAVLNATDNFTGAELMSEQDPLSTRFSTDPAYREGDEVVGQ
ncbi:MAG: hypothetical protein QOG91_108 [Candidatus Parcubacteria bacterium]|nr:hypothetical protein [Candidatus Parcubacteria bacterium]